VTIIERAQDAVPHLYALSAAHGWHQQLTSKGMTEWEKRAVSRLSRRLDGLFADAGSEAVRRLLDTGRYGDVQSQRKILKALEQRTGALQRSLFAQAQESAQHGRNRIISELQKAGMSVQFDSFSPRISEMLREHVFEGAGSTMRRLRGDVMGTLQQAYEEGLGIDEAAEYVKGQFDTLRDFEAKRIARTEINARQGEGAHLTEIELGVNWHKWVAADDQRTRDTHREQHNMIVRVDTPFPITGMKYPGDFDNALDEGEAINCRCRVIPFLPPPGKRFPPGQDGPFYEEDLIDRS